MEEIKSNTDNIIEWIWFYYDQGFSIIPLGKREVEPYNKHLKKPSLEEWKTYSNKRATKQEIQGWIDQGLFVNIGVVCGAISNNLVIIDVDDESIPDLIKLDFKSMSNAGAWPVKTGEGYQIFTMHHSNPGPLKRYGKHKLEYRSNGGYCVVPPSIHPTGKQYHFIGFDDYNQLPTIKQTDAKGIFKELKDKVGKAWDIKTPVKRPMDPANTSGVGDYPKCVEVALDTITKHPMRYPTLYGIASSFAMQNIPKDLALKRIKQFNMEKCVPPKDNKDVENAVHGAYSEGSKKFGCDFWMDDAELCPFENMSECYYGDKKNKRELLKKYEVYETKENKNGDIVRTGRIIAPRLAKLLMNGDGGVYVTLKDNEELLRYDGRIYGKTAKSYIKSRVNYYLGDDATKRIKEEVIDFMKGENLIEREALDGDKGLLPLENGIYDMGNRKLIPYDPKYYFTHFLPVNYDKDAKIKKIQTFFDEILPVEYIPVLQQFLGDCLTTEYKYKKAVLAAGPRNTGKSTLLNLLGAFLGEENISHASLYELCVGEYSSAGLYNKRANICAQAESNNLTKVNKFLSLTGMDYINAREIYQAPFSFVNFAKLIFSCNKIPTTDLSGEIAKAYYIRWLVFPFENIFEGTVRDVDMLTKMIDNKQEMSGLLNWALEGLDILKKNKGYFEVMSMEETKEFMEKGTNPIREFVDTNMERSSGRTYVTNAYKEYVQFCREHSYPYVNDVWFARKAFPLLPIGSKKGHTKKKRYWDGVTLISTKRKEGQNEL